MSQGRRSEQKLERVTRLEQLGQAAKAAPSQRPADLDAAGRLAHLAQVFKRTPGESPAPATPPAPSELPSQPPDPSPAPLATPAPASNLWGRLIKTGIGLAIILTVGYAPLQRLFQTSSVEAVVNARTITLRAPIDGEVRAPRDHFAFGATLAPGEELFSIVNRRADRTRLDDLRRQLATLEEDRPLLAERLKGRQTLFADLSGQTRLFLAGRIAQLEARAGELRSMIESTTAQKIEAKATLARIVELARTKVESPAALERAKRDYNVATQALAGAESRLEANNVELDAARRGTFIGDSYNDRPRSSQRADELQQEIAELEWTLRAHDERLSRLSADVAEESNRFADLSAATLAAPTRGSVWEVMTAPGEEVRKGQDLLRVLDCSGAVVTAVVSETVYNRLRVGSPATFRFRDGGKDLPGSVVRLTGVAASPANLAIQPAALIKESYHVTVNVPALAAEPGCAVGRTGRVIFEPAPKGAADQAP
jgi:multidrug resistance efflux pump